MSIHLDKDLTKLKVAIQNLGLLTTAAVNNAIHALVGADSELANKVLSQSSTIDDKEVFRIMKERNPQVFKGIKEDLNRKIREGQNPRPTQQPQPMPVKQPSEQSFLEMGVQE